MIKYWDLVSALWRVLAFIRMSLIVDFKVLTPRLKWTGSRYREFCLQSWDVLSTEPGKTPLFQTARYWFSLRSSHGRRKDFFQGGPVGDFPKIFSRGAKSGEIWFLPLEIEKTTFFANNFKIRGGQGRPRPPLPTPMLRTNITSVNEIAQC